MRSAYLALGVPGDASASEIDEAYQRALQLFTKERLATEDGALARLAELKDAYRILRDPDARAAHDRKLAAPARPAPGPRTIVVERQETSPVARAAVIGICLLVLVFSAGAYISHRNAERRQEMAAQERAAREAAEREAARQQQEAARAETQRAQAEDRRLELEARRRVEQDKQRVRELCLQLYRRPDC